MNIYKKIGEKINQTKTRCLPGNVETYIGESIEQKIKRILRDGEPISDTAPLLYDEGEEIDKECDIRTDKWDIAAEESHSVGAKIIELKSTIAKEKQAKAEE